MFTDCIGPRELIIFDTGAIKPILGISSKARKGPFYDTMEQSLHITTDHEFHKKRRKIWDMAFKQALSDYGPTIKEFTDTLLARVEDNIEKSIIINELFIHYSYDIMSFLAFGSPTKFLEGKSTDTATKILNNIQGSVGAIRILLHILWMLTILEYISFASPMVEFNNWAADQVKKRRSVYS